MKKEMLVTAIACAAAAFNAYAAPSDTGIRESTDPARAEEVLAHARALGFTEQVATSGTGTSKPKAHHKSKTHKHAHSKAKADKPTADKAGSAAPQ